MDLISVNKSLKVKGIYEFVRSNFKVSGVRGKNKRWREGSSFGYDIYSIIRALEGEYKLNMVNELERKVEAHFWFNLPIILTCKVKIPGKLVVVNQADLKGEVD